MYIRSRFSLKAVAVTTAVVATLLLSGCSDSDDPVDDDVTDTDTDPMSNPMVTRNIQLTVAETEPMATAPDASGEANFTVDTATGAISGSATVMGTTGTPTAAHIHVGAVGVPGDIVLALEPNADSLVWSAPAGAALDAAGIESFNAGELYVNVHTEANMTGELRGQLDEEVAPAPAAGSYQITFVNTSTTQPMTPPVVAFHSTDIRVFEVGQPADGGVIEIAENGNLAPQVEALEGQLGGTVSAVGVAHPDPENPGGPLLPGATSTLTLTPVGEDQVMSVVSMVVCTNDGFSGVDSVELPEEETTTMAPIYDAGSETNVLTLDYWVPPCGTDENLGDEENGAITAHPGQSGSEGTGFDFDAGTELLQITVTPN
ncbi:MAG: spondin domain-containing protein [Granulosicoccus sp.]